MVGSLRARDRDASVPSAAQARTLRRSARRRSSRTRTRRSSGFGTGGSSACTAALPAGAGRAAAPANRGRSALGLLRATLKLVSRRGGPGARRRGPLDLLQRGNTWCSSTESTPSPPSCSRTPSARSASPTARTSMRPGAMALTSPAAACCGRCRHQGCRTPRPASCHGQQHRQARGSIQNVLGAFVVHDFRNELRSPFGCPTCGLSGTLERPFSGSETGVMSRTDTATEGQAIASSAAWVPNTREW